MHVTTGETRQQDIPDHHYFLGFGGHTLKSELRANDALIHRASRGKRRLFTMIDDRDLERACVLERSPHELRAHDWLTVIADSNRPCSHHLAKLRQNFPFLSERDRADRVHASGCCTLRLSDDESDRGLIVGNRIGVGHGAHGSEATRSRRSRSSRDRFNVFAARLTEMAVNVYEAGRNEESFAVNRFRILRAVDPTHCRYLSVRDQ
jgi:hypothetical protein